MAMANCNLNGDGVVFTFFALSLFLFAFSLLQDMKAAELPRLFDGPEEGQRAIAACFGNSYNR